MYILEGKFISIFNRSILSLSRVCGEEANERTLSRGGLFEFKCISFICIAFIVLSCSILIFTYIETHGFCFQNVVKF